jgi:tRNA isopentenyl-2-thiomethyl-A-37 hydroxylase MiaE
MANEQRQYKSHLNELKKIAATAGISNKVDAVRESVAECISASQRPGDGMSDDDL